VASKNFLSQSNAIRVSIIVPVFNGEETLARAIDSALAQTFVGKEIIVVDDGSTDSSLALLQRYGSKIRLVQQKNAGAARARNLGIDLALGEYLAFLDQDDFWAPQKLAHQVEFLDEHP